jgi:hypothetical protein
VEEPIPQLLGEVGVLQNCSLHCMTTATAINPLPGQVC